MKNILATATGNKDFSTLVDAIKKAHLEDTLQGNKEYTVFAPNNEAFDTMSKEEFKELLQNEEELQNILKYHIIPGKVWSKDIKNKEYKTAQGDNIRINTKEGVKVNDSNVITTDIETSNGIIHVIDKPLVPSRKTK
ncbi:MAG: fasciclin domain-containing protein [Thermoplasmatota archaeon]